VSSFLSFFPGSIKNASHDIIKFVTSFLKFFLLEVFELVDLINSDQFSFAELSAFLLGEP